MPFIRTSQGLGENKKKIGLLVKAGCQPNRVFTCYMSLQSSCFLSPCVFSPHHFLSQGGEIFAACALHDVHIVRSFADGEHFVFGTRGRLTVDGDEEVVASAAHGERDGGIVGNDNRADVEAVGCHRCEAQRAGLEHDDGASVGQRIGSRARRSAHYQAVSLIGDQIFTVDACLDGNH